MTTFVRLTMPLCAILCLPAAALAQLSGGGDTAASGRAPGEIAGRWVGAIMCESGQGWAVSYTVSESAADKEALMEWRGGQANGTDQYDVFQLGDDRYLFASRSAAGRDFDLSLAGETLAGPQRGEACSAYLMPDRLTPAAE